MASKCCLYFPKDLPIDGAHLYGKYLSSKRRKLSKEKAVYVSVATSTCGKWCMALDFWLNLLRRTQTIYTFSHLLFALVIIL